MKNSATQGRLYRILKWIVRVLIAQLVLINISAAFHAYRFTHYFDDDKVRRMESSAGKPLLRTWRLMVGRKLPKSLISYFPPMPYDTEQLTTRSGLKLEAWYIKADSSKGTVILFHGLHSNKGNILSEAMEFLSFGYNTMLVDTRAHGNSEGINNSLGYWEPEEVKLAYDFVKNKGENNIILWGISLGAVIISKAIYDFELQPQKVILEMPFDRLQHHLRARARVLGFPEEPFGFLVTLWTGIEQRYWSFGHKTSRYVTKIKCPVLLQWGALDEYVKRKETNAIFSAISSPQKKLVLYNNAGHQPLLWHDGYKWKETVQVFLNHP
jgi:hypothetical protein